MSEQSYPIKIWNGILKDGHCQKIGNALWEFIWLIDKVTLEKNGIGYVLRGKPIKVEDICNFLERSYHTVYRHLKLLEDFGYINIKKAPYGIIITVNNSKKFSDRLIRNDKASLGKNDKAGLSKKIKRLSKNEESLIKNINRLNKNDKSIKTLRTLKDITIHIENIFDFWNSKEIIKHNILKNDTVTKIRVLMNDYSIKEIKQSIHCYSGIIEGDEYYFKYRWTLKEFLQRGFEKFLDPDVAHENYLIKKDRR